MTKKILASLAVLVAASTASADPSFPKGLAPDGSDCPGKKVEDACTTAGGQVGKCDKRRHCIVEMQVYCPPPPVRTGKPSKPSVGTECTADEDCAKYGESYICRRGRCVNPGKKPTPPPIPIGKCPVCVKELGAKFTALMVDLLKVCPVRMVIPDKDKDGKEVPLSEADQKLLAANPRCSIIAEVMVRIQPKLEQIRENADKYFTKKDAELDKLQKQVQDLIAELNNLKEPLEKLPDTLQAFKFQLNSIWVALGERRKDVEALKTGLEEEKKRLAVNIEAQVGVTASDQYAMSRLGVCATLMPRFNDRVALVGGGCIGYMAGDSSKLLVEGRAGLAIRLDGMTDGRHVDLVLGGRYAAGLVPGYHSSQSVDDKSLRLWEAGGLVRLQYVAKHISLFLETNPGYAEALLALPARLVKGFAFTGVAGIGYEF